MEVPQENIRERLAELMSRRDKLEAELITHHDDLKKENVGMTDPLVDNEGYPRGDIDIYRIRVLRQEINRKQNDCKELTREIEEGLHILHAEEKTVSSCGHPREHPDGPPQPFAKVDLVDNNSPAQKADLRVGDLLVKFGSLKSRNFESLSEVAQLVNSSLKKPIHVSVIRNSQLVPLILVPDEWSGNGHLGCRIVPIR